MVGILSYGHSTLFVVQMKAWSVCAYIREEANPFIQQGDQVLRYQPTYYSLQATYYSQAVWKTPS